MAEKICRVIVREASGEQCYGCGAIVDRFLIDVIYVFYDSNHTEHYTSFEHCPWCIDSVEDVWKMLTDLAAEIEDQQHEKRLEYGD